MALTRWHNGGVKRGLAVRLCSTGGDVLYVASNEDADALVTILNSLEEASAFGHQCMQDRYENAYVEASVVKKIQVALDDAVLALQDAERMVEHLKKF